MKKAFLTCRYHFALDPCFPIFLCMQVQVAFYKYETTWCCSEIMFCKRKNFSDSASTSTQLHFRFNFNFIQFSYFLTKLVNACRQDIAIDNLRFGEVY